MRTTNDSSWRNVWQPVVDRLKKARQYYQQRTEFNALDGAVKQQIAQELGISTSELSALAGRDENTAKQLLQRLAELGLDPKSIDPVVMRDLQRCCSSCDSKTLCDHELEDRPQEAKWPDYCPNEQTLVALMATKMPCH
jgi:transcriptional regulator with XRE-family HTH domain